MKKLIQEFRNMDPKERKKKIWLFVGIVFVLILGLSLIK
jgi:hypothetical protein